MMLFVVAVGLLMLVEGRPFYHEVGTEGTVARVVDETSGVGLHQKGLSETGCSAFLLHQVALIEKSVPRRPLYDEMSQSACEALVIHYVETLQSVDCVLSEDDIIDLHEQFVLARTWAMSVLFPRRVNVADLVDTFLETNQLHKVAAVYSMSSGFFLDPAVVRKWWSDRLFWSWHVWASEGGNLNPLYDEWFAPISARSYEYVSQLTSQSSSGSMALQPPLTSSFFVVSYIASQWERPYKSFWHKHVLAPNAPELPAHVPGCDQVKSSLPRLLLVSVSFKGLEAVFRNFYPIVEELSRHFTLDIATGHSGSQLEAKTKLLVENAFQLTAKGMDLSTSAEFFCPGRYDAVLFLDIGMGHQTSVLAHVRLAPLQMATYGHSVSTFGATQIDYWLGAHEVEVASLAEVNYSERLVLLDGLGVSFSLIHESFIHPVQRAMNPTTVRILNLLWTSSKIVHESLDVVQAIYHQSAVPLKLQFLTSSGQNFGMQVEAWMRGLEKALVRRGLAKNDFTIIPQLYPEDYQQRLIRGFLSLDNVPYGGCNTVFDSLVARIPIVMLEGKVWHNRIGPALARRLIPHHADALIATTASEYVHKAVALLHDNDLYTSVSMALATKEVSEFENVGGDTAKAYPIVVERLMHMDGDSKSRSP